MYLNMLTKIFIGARFTPELRAELGNQAPDGLQIIPYQGKEFVGAYLDSPAPSVSEMRHFSSHLMTALQTSCPNLRSNHFHIVVFPQLFLG